jgi:type IV secretory pathway TrbD component
MYWGRYKQLWIGIMKWGGFNIIKYNEAYIKFYGLVIWNVAVLNINKCTEADINCYGLVLWNVAVLNFNKCTEADINCYGLVLWMCRFCTSLNELKRI